MAEIPEEIQHGARIELARREFWEYCKFRYPKLYTEDRVYLKTLCERLEHFVYYSDKRYMLVSLPPRHLKTLTVTNLIEYVLGKDKFYKVMYGGYNEILSSKSASKVRDTIAETGSNGSTVYNDIFPDTIIKQGNASKQLWGLVGNSEDNFLATSPTGTATGFGANLICVDDVIKNALEALNERVLDNHYDWLTNTMLSRTEGDDWKVLIVHTRWATGDLIGRVIADNPDNVEIIEMPAEQPDGSMLCDDILSRESFIDKTKNMKPEIREANYNQKPIDLEGRLYKGFQEWTTLPSDVAIKRNTTDVADEGSDNVCSINWFSVKTEEDTKVYITDIYYSPDKAEITEPEVAKMITAGEINEAEFESNNGGKGYARNIERELIKLDNRKTVVSWTPQTSNKEARILASSAWNTKNILMPPNWTSKYPDFAAEVLGYVAGGKNPHDDGVDVLATIYERAANVYAVEYGGIR